MIVQQPCLWREEDGVIYFNVTSDGTTGRQWIGRIEKNALDLGSFTKSILLSPDFKSTSGVTTGIAVIKGEFWESGNDRMIKNIRAEAKKRKWSKPNAEVACLIREKFTKFTDKELVAMGLWGIVAMHDPINDSKGKPCLLASHQLDDDCRFCAFSGSLDHKWRQDCGFAFTVS